jgi:O-antigen/teichoic acid export membrane protein
LHYALEQAIFPVIGSILEKVLSTFFGILLLRSGYDVQGMALVLLGGSLVGVIWQAICFYHRVGTGFVIDFALIRKLIRTNIPFLIYGVLSVIYYNVDAVLLSFMTNTAVVGWYGAAYRLFDTLTFLPNLVISTIMYPIFSKLSITSESDLKLAVEKSMNFLLFCGIPITVALIILAPNIISFLYYRAEFTSAIPALQALSPGLIFLYINTALGTTILSKRQDRKIPIMAAIALVFNLGLNLIVIPLYQHIGAAIVTSLTELLLLFIAVVFIPKQLLPLGSLQVGAKALLASLVMAVIIWHLRTWNIFALVSTATLLYLGVAMLLKTIPSEDMQALYRAIGFKV